MSLLSFLPKAYATAGTAGGGATAGTAGGGAAGGATAGGAGIGGGGGSHFTMSVGNFETGLQDMTILDIMNNLWGALMYNGYWICAAVFFIGAFLYTSSAGDEQRKSKGKDLMIGAVMGAAVIAGAQGIMNTVLFFLYG